MDFFQKWIYKVDLNDKISGLNWSLWRCENGEEILVDPS